MDKCPLGGQIEPIVRRELVHRWMSDLQEFLSDIDKTGGWPVGYTHVSFHHGGDRYCKFTNKALRTGWWTTICKSDDYYYWKLSDAKKKDILKLARQQIIKQLR